MNRIKELETILDQIIVSARVTGTPFKSLINTADSILNKSPIDQRFAPSNFADIEFREYFDCGQNINAFYTTLESKCKRKLKIGINDRAPYFDVYVLKDGSAIAFIEYHNEIKPLPIDCPSELAMSDQINNYHKMILTTKINPFLFPADQ